MDGQVCKKSCMDDIDRISSLPGGLKSKILVLLPIEEAVRTSLLSSKWRYEWASIPDLVFNHLSRFRKAHMQTGLVDMVLMLHQGPICKFELDIPRECIPALGRWILFLSRNGIEQIKITSPSHSVWKMPCPFFTVQSLKDVWLDRCNLKLPPTFSGLKHLKSLKLEYCLISDQDLVLLTSTCPNMENFQLLLAATHVIGITLNAPKLRELELRGFEVKYIHLSTPCLVKAALCFSAWSKHERDCQKNATDLLDSLSKIESLELSGLFMQHLTRGCDLEPSFMFDHLKKLTLQLDLARLLWAVPALFLLKKAPNLETLSILSFIVVANEIEPFPISLWEASIAKFLFQNLRFVSIKCQGRDEYELAVVKLILATAPVLVSLHLTNMAKFDTNAEFYKKLVRYKRASKEAEIIVD